MNLERLFDLVDQERRDAAEFREVMRTELGAIRGDIQVLQTQRNAVGSAAKVVGWFAVFLVSVVAILISASSCH